MAVTWTPYPNGESLATVRTNINLFNNAVKNNIDSIETSISSIESDITDLGTDKVSVSDTGLVYIVDGTMPSASLTTTYQKVGMVNTTSINEANGHITVNNTLYTYTVNTTGIYKFVFSGAMTADSGDIIEFNYNINGSSVITNPPQFRGDGTRIVSINSYFVVNLTAGSVVYIEAKSDATSTMTPINCGFMIEKTHY